MRPWWAAWARPRINGNTSEPNPPHRAGPSCSPLLTARYRSPRCFPSVEERLRECFLVWAFSRKSAGLQTERKKYPRTRDFAPEHGHTRQRKSSISEGCPSRCCWRICGLKMAAFERTSHGLWTIALPRRLRHRQRTQCFRASHGCTDRPFRASLRPERGLHPSAALEP